MRAGTPGFSLLELLCVIGLLSFLLLILGGHYNQNLRHERLQQAATRIFQALQFARSQALQRGERVCFCGSVDGIHCDEKWKNGQIVHFKISQVLLRLPALDPSLSIQWKSALGLNTTLCFNADGSTAGAQGHFSIGSIGGLNQNEIRIVITHSGRARVDTQPSVASGSLASGSLEVW